MILANQSACLTTLISLLLLLIFLLLFSVRLSLSQTHFVLILDLFIQIAHVNVSRIVIVAVYRWPAACVTDQWKSKRWDACAEIINHQEMDIVRNQRDVSEKSISLAFSFFFLSSPSSNGIQLITFFCFCCEHIYMYLCACVYKKPIGI